MQIYLPIAEISIDVFLLLGIGAGVGFLSGMFGVGGGFLLTPILIFIGVPPPVAVATQSNQLVAASVSGVLAHWSRGNVDFKMGGVLTLGGLIGSTAGVFLFGVLKKVGQIDVAISVAYVVLLGGTGSMMLFEGTRSLLRRRRPTITTRKLHEHRWIHRLPLRLRFRQSRLYVSAIVPVAIGLVIGLMSAVLGIGGAFLLVPALIYILGMPTSIVIGTSLFQIIFVTANVTFLQAVQNQTVDAVLAGLLVIGSVIGAQFGGRIAARVPGEQLRILLALLILTVCWGLLDQLFEPPRSIFGIEVL